MTPPFFLFLFVSSAFIPVSTLPGWLQPFARYQPITIFTDTLRDLTQGQAATAVLPNTTTWYITASLAWCAALTLLFAPLALRSYRRL
jgi:ABC-2 type transport system permease protein